MAFLIFPGISCEKPKKRLKFDGIGTLRATISNKLLEMEYHEIMIRTAIITSLLLRGLRHKKANNILTLH